MPEASVEPSPGEPRFPLLDGMRAVAAGLVVLSHTSTAAGGPVWVLPTASRLGSLGVAIFFVLSGFLLYRPFVARRLRGEARPSVAVFWARRALRIVPAYWLALTLLAIWPGLRGVHSDHWWVFYGFGQIYSFDFTLQGLGPAWSLCTEVTFYAALPLLAVVLAGRAVKLRRELMVLLALALLSVTYRMWTATPERSYMGASLLGTFAWFAAGMAVATVHVHRPAFPAGLRRPAEFARARPAVCFGLAAAAFAVMDVPLGITHLTAPGNESVPAALLFFGGLGLAATLLVVGTVVGDPRPPGTRRFLLRRPLPWLGTISYGIYLWHFPLLYWVGERARESDLPRVAQIAGTAVVGGAATVTAAAISYYALERPLLRLRHRVRAPSEPPLAQPLTLSTAPAAEKATR